MEEKIMERYQPDIIEAKWQKKWEEEKWQHYVDSRRLEITCGEGRCALF